MQLAGKAQTRTGWDHSDFSPQSDFPSYGEVAPPVMALREIDVESQVSRSQHLSL